jgi:hypothetical protein
MTRARALNGRAVGADARATGRRAPARERATARERARWNGDGTRARA